MEDPHHSEHTSDHLAVVYDDRVHRIVFRLQTDVIFLFVEALDGRIFIANECDYDVAILRDSGVYETLAELKREGKLRAFGLSGKTVEGGLLALERGDCAMVTYNLAERGEQAVLDHAATHGKGILIKKALASGHAVLAGEDPVRASFELVFSHPGVTAAIVGTINPQHLAANAATAAAVIRG